MVPTELGIADDPPSARAKSNDPPSKGKAPSSTGNNPSSKGESPSSKGKAADKAPDSDADTSDTDEDDEGQDEDSTFTVQVLLAQKPAAGSGPVFRPAHCVCRWPSRKACDFTATRLARARSKS